MTTRRIGTGRLTVVELRRRSIESKPRLKSQRHPDAAAAGEAWQFLQWMLLGGAKPTTLYTYGWTLDKLLGAFPDTPYAAFTDAELLYILGTTTQKSRQRWVAVYRSFFKWGLRTRRITVNPCDFLPDFKSEPHKIPEVFTPQEEAALRALPGADGALCALLLDTGIRNTEARLLTGKRIDFAAERLIVLEGAKGGKERTIPIDNGAAPGLLGRLDGLLTMEGIGANDHLWPIRPGGGHRIKRDRPISPPSMHTWWCNRIADAGITYRSLHVARHSFATRWRKMGLDLGDIQLLLGHADIGTTVAIYVHVEPEDVRKRMVAVRAASERVLVGEEA